MEQDSQSTEKVQDFSPDKIISGHLVDELMQALQHSEEARYKLYLKLKVEFGAGKI